MVHIFRYSSKYTYLHVHATLLLSISVRNTNTNNLIKIEANANQCDIPHKSSFSPRVCLLAVIHVFVSPCAILPFVIYSIFFVFIRVVFVKGEPPVSVASGVNHVLTGRDSCNDNPFQSSSFGGTVLGLAS